MHNYSKHPPLNPTTDPSPQYIVTWSEKGELLKGVYEITALRIMKFNFTPPKFDKLRGGGCGRINDIFESLFLTESDSKLEGM